MKDLFFAWDFGDSSSAERVVYKGRSFRSNDQQLGNRAVHCYRTPGTYTIRLKIWGKNGSVFIYRVATQEITVTAFTAAANKKLYFDSVGGSDANDGLSESTPKQTLSAINTSQGDSDNTQIMVKRGSSFDGSAAFFIWNAATTTRTGFRVEPYGEGAIPTFNVSSGTDSALFAFNGGSSSPRPKSDIVISGIRLSTSGTNSSNAAAYLLLANTSAAISNFYFDSCEFHDGADNASCNGVTMSASITSLLSKFGKWNCRHTGLMGDTVQTHMGAYAHGQEWYFDVGSYYEGGNSPLSLFREHHTYPSIRHESLHRWITFGPGANRSYCINLDADLGDGEVAYADNHLIADCYFTGTDWAHDASNGQNRADLTLFRNLICERCDFHDLRLGGVLFYCAQDYTHRYNKAWKMPARYFNPSLAQLGGILKSEFYGNKGYFASNSGLDYIINLDNAGWTQPHYIGHNIWQDMRSTARILAIPFAQSVTANDNQYYAPNDSNSKAWYDATVEKSFAELQGAGFDLNGVVQNPNWRDPANGDFSQAA